MPQLVSLSHCSFACTSAFISLSLSLSCSLSLCGVLGAWPLLSVHMGANCAVAVTTLQLLRTAKRFQATTSFESDAQLSDAKDKGAYGSGAGRGGERCCGQFAKQTR